MVWLPNEVGSFEVNGISYDARYTLEFYESGAFMEGTLARDQKVREGDILEVNLQEGQIKNLTNGEILKFDPLPDFLLDILESGGLEPYVTKQIAAGKM